MARPGNVFINRISVGLAALSLFSCDSGLKTDAEISVNTGVIQGIVVDAPSGKALPKFQVMLLMDGKQILAETLEDDIETAADEAGTFRFKNVPVEADFVLKVVQPAPVVAPVEGEEEKYQVVDDTAVLDDASADIASGVTDTSSDTTTDVLDEASTDIAATATPLGNYAAFTTTVVRIKAVAKTSDTIPSNTEEPVVLDKPIYSTRIAMYETKGAVHGTVVNDLGVVSGAQVVIDMRNLGFDVLQSTTTNADGVFQFSGLPAYHNISNGAIIAYPPQVPGQANMPGDMQYYASSPISNFSLAGGQTHVNITLSTYGKTFTSQPTIFGKVTDARTRERIAGAAVNVLLRGQWQEITQTLPDNPATAFNEKGTFTATLPFGEVFRVMFSAPNYEDSLNGSSYNIGKNQQSEINATLNRNNFSFRGKLFSQFGPVPGATILLDPTQCSTPAIGTRKAITVAEGPDKGTFVFGNIPFDNAIVNCSLVIPPYDQDGDGFPDYETRVVTISSFLSSPQTIEQIEATPFNINLHILSSTDNRKEPRVVFSSIEDANFAGVDDNFTLFFSNSIDAKTLPNQITLVNNTDGGNVDLVASLGEDKVTITINPLGKLEAGDNYTLTLKNGIKGINGKQITQYQRTFDARAALPLLAGVLPRIDFGTLDLCSDTGIDCLPDTVKVDVATHYFFNNAKNSTQKLGDEGASAARGLEFDIEWNAVAGAKKYKIFGKDNVRHSDWTELATVDALDPVSGTVEKTTLDLTTQFGNEPFRDGNQVSLTIISVNLDGTEGALDQTKVLILKDDFKPMIDSVETLGGNDFSDATHKEILKFTMSEYLDRGTMPTVSTSSPFIGASVIGFDDDGDNVNAFLVQLSHKEVKTTESTATDATSDTATSGKIYVKTDDADIFWVNQKISIAGSVCQIIAVDTSSDTIAPFVTVTPGNCTPALVEDPANGAQIAVDPTSATRSPNTNITAVNDRTVTVSSIAGFIKGETVTIDPEGDNPQTKIIKNISGSDIEFTTALAEDVNIVGTDIQSKGDAIVVTAKDSSGNDMNPNVNEIFGDSSIH